MRGTNEATKPGAYFGSNTSSDTLATMAKVRKSSEDPNAHELRILVIRRDNIGDLVCTLPLFESLRRHYPNARLGALVNSYNAPLLAGNPFVDHIHIYTKSKHRPQGTRLALTRDRLGLLLELRGLRYQTAVHAGSRVRAEMRLLARFAGIKHEILDHPSDQPLHEVERVHGLLHAFGISGPPPAPGLTPHATKLAAVRGSLAEQGFGGAIGLHISAREDENRWPLENFAALIRAGADQGHKFVIFWSPGDTNRPEHPGDDDRARALMELCRDLPVIAYPTADLATLTAALAAIPVLVGSDGGHCHIAAAVGTRVIGLYCSHKTRQWQPWGTAHTVLSATQVKDISVEAVLSALPKIARR